MVIVPLDASPQRFDVPSLPISPRCLRTDAAAATPDSLFLSEAWHSACLETWRDRVKFQEVTLTAQQMPGGRPARALISRRVEIRHGFLPVRVIALNQSGSAILDQPWIERNGFFDAPPNGFPELLSQLLDRLAADQSWDEFKLGGLIAEHARETLYQAARHGLTARLDLEQPSFQIDLDLIRTRFGGDYLAGLSANTRQQLRRSRRLAERTLGELRLEEAVTLDQVFEWFNATGPLHRNRWGNPDRSAIESGFANPEFVAFHQRLMRHAFPSGGIQYFRLNAGDTTLAYLYNFVKDRNIHFYLSGINYEVDSGIRPGMLAHWLAVEANLKAGKHVYDFLAGNARYKRSLSTGEDRTLWLVLQRSRARLQLEGLARRLKRSLSGASSTDLLDNIPHASPLR